ncbi:MAG TPA: hypothetical protein DC057_10780 [Spirochaetia bacterium]|nr:hypothetical protein [Spirochaetia bacterium]
MIEYEKAYFIKLGKNGIWEKKCIDEGIIRLGFPNPFHEECLSGNFEPLRTYFEDEKQKSKGVVTSIINLIKVFYESNERILWITFYNRKLWWCFLKNGINEIENGSRIRSTINGWSSSDINGNELSIDKLSGKLTKVQMYQGTICEVKEREYLRNRINNKVAIEVDNAMKNLHVLENSLIPLIRNLPWKEFELLVDLIFSYAGWKRLGIIGKSEKDIDLDLIMPVNERRAFVQVKAASDQNEFDKYEEYFYQNGIYDEMYYVVHTMKSSIIQSDENKNVYIIDINKLIKLVINAGLIS